VKPRKIDEARCMTPEQHAICDISERLFKHSDRLDTLERAMRLMDKELRALREGNRGGINTT
jgi:hypothetical protein